MSQGAFLLLVAWGVDRWFNGPIFRGRTWGFWRVQTVLWGVLALFSWELVSQLWSENLPYGWRSMRIQLPLLAFPLVLITGRWDARTSIPLVKNTLAVSIATACLACLWFGLQAEGDLRPRDWSPFISHIRFSLMITFVWGWWVHESLNTRSKLANGVALALGILGIAFTWKSASLTAMLLFPVAAMVVLWQAHMMRRAVGFVGVASLGFVLAVCWLLWPRYPAADTLTKRTELGEVYEHFPERCLRENGTPVWTHIAWSELSEGWSARSDRPIEGLDGRNQELRMTLIRFLASKGLTKDRAGIKALSDREIERIEMGIPTVLEMEHSGLMRRLDAVKFEVWNAWDGGNPSGHSLIQRWAFLRTGLHIYQHHPVFGVGIGDVPDAFEWAYDDLNSPLQESFRLRAHNQYLTFLIAGGPLNLILFLGILAALLPRLGSGSALYSTPALLFCVILSLSCLTEDTLETQAGVTFAGFLIGLFGRRLPLPNSR